MQISGEGRHYTLGHALGAERAGLTEEVGSTAMAARGRALPEFSPGVAEAAELPRKKARKDTAKLNRRETKLLKSPEGGDPDQKDPWFASFGTAISRVFSSA